MVAAARSAEALEVCEAIPRIHIYVCTCMLIYVYVCTDMLMDVYFCTCILIYVYSVAAARSAEALVVCEALARVAEESTRIYMYECDCISRIYVYVCTWILVYVCSMLIY